MPTATPLLLRGSRENNKYRNSLDLNKIPPRFVFRILQVNLTSETFLSVRANIGKSSENFGSTPKVFESTSEIFVSVRINFEIRRKTFLFSSYFILSGALEMSLVNQDNPSQCLKTVKDVSGRFGIFWFVVGRCGSFWVRCGSLWVVVDRCGSFWVVPRFSNYASLRKQRKCASSSKHAVIPIQLSTTANTVHSQSIRNRHHFRHTTN